MGEWTNNRPIVNVYNSTATYVGSKVRYIKKFDLNGNHEYEEGILMGFFWVDKEGDLWALIECQGRIDSCNPIGLEFL